MINSSATNVDYYVSGFNSTDKRVGSIICDFDPNKEKNAIMRSMHFSHEYLKAQSERLEAAWREREREEKLRRKSRSSSKAGQ